MPLSRRKIFILGLVTPMLFYAASVRIQSLRTKRYFAPNSEKILRDVAYEKQSTKQKLVILYSNQRSGSTFMGEIFNQNKDAFYLYEPLFPFTPHCNVLNRERVNVLEKMLKCNFFDNRDSFKHAQTVTNFRDSPSNCIRNGACFMSHSEALRRRYKPFCNDQLSAEECSSSLRPDVSSKLCASADIVAYKVLRVCTLEDIDEMYQRLSNGGKDVFVVHLVRDPRAIISSKLKLELKEGNMLERTEELCQRMNKNLEFVENTTDIPRLVKDRKYIRIRYEDAASDPVTIASKVYRFLGLPLPDEVRYWINNSTILPRQRLQDLREQLKTQQSFDKHTIASRYVALAKQLKDPYGTVKDPSSTIQKWRYLLPLETVLDVQRICSRVLKRLKYKPVSNAKELGDLGKQLWL